MTRSKKSILRLLLAALLILGTLGTCFAALPTVTILGTIAGELRAPGKMVLDGAGNLYVADVQNRGIVKFDAAARYAGVIKVPGVVRSLALSPDGRLLVSHGGSVTFYGRDGMGEGDLTGYPFLEPNGIAVDDAGDIYVADSRKNEIAVFTPAGAFARSFGSGGKKQGELNFPTALCFEKSGKLLGVADTLNNRVQFFGTDGVFRKSVGSPSSLSGPLSFTYPDGIAFDYSSGVRMYVADGFQNSVQVIDLEAQPKFVGYLGNYGPGDGEFLQLSDVLFDQAKGRMITADATGLVTFFAIGGDGASLSMPAGLTPPAIPGATAAGSQAPAQVPSAATSSSRGGGAPEGRGANLSWQYPSGIDCRHGKVGSVLCR